jgi:hypothetical protein
MAPVITSTSDSAGSARVGPETIVLALRSARTNVRVEPLAASLWRALPQSGWESEDKFTFVSAERNVASVQRIPSDKHSVGLFIAPLSLCYRSE